MQTVLYKALGIICAAVILVGMCIWGIRQYGNSRVAQAAQESVQGAVREAVADRKEAVKVDVAQTAERATAARKVQAVLISHREKSKTVQGTLNGISHYETTSCASADAARLRVFLDAASAVNRIVSTTESLH